MCVCHPISNWYALDWDLVGTLSKHSLSYPPPPSRWAPSGSCALGILAIWCLQGMAFLWFVISPFFHPFLINFVFYASEASLFFSKQRGSFYMVYMNHLGIFFLHNSFMDLGFGCFKINIMCGLLILYLHVFTQLVISWL